jgi:hypothetical protein
MREHVGPLDSGTVKNPAKGRGTSGPSLAGGGDVLDGVRGEHIVTVMSDLQQKWVYDG